MFNKKIKNKKGQAGETITWVFATLIIVVVLLISISVANFMGGNKKFIYTKTADILAAKSLFSYLLTEEEGEDKTIYEKIKEEDDFTEFNGELAVKIFKEFYKNDYSKVWLGFGGYAEIFLEAPMGNKYFGTRPKTSTQMLTTSLEEDYISNRVCKGEDSAIELLLILN